MLKGLDPRLSPSLVADLAALGHVDTILVADANFPVSRLQCNVHYLPLPSETIVALLLDLVPIEIDGGDSVVTRSDTPESALTDVQQRVRELVRRAEPRFAEFSVPDLDRFVALATTATVAIVSAETRPACFLVKRGVVL